MAIIIDDDGIMHKVLTNNEVISILQDIDIQLENVGAVNREVAKTQRFIRDKIKYLRGNEFTEESNDLAQ